MPARGSASIETLWGRAGGRVLGQWGSTGPQELSLPAMASAEGGLEKRLRFPSLLQPWLYRTSSPFQLIPTAENKVALFVKSQPLAPPRGFFIPQMDPGAHCTEVVQGQEDFSRGPEVRKVALGQLSLPQAMSSIIPAGSSRRVPCRALLLCPLAQVLDSFLGLTCGY